MFFNKRNLAGFFFPSLYLPSAGSSTNGATRNELQPGTGIEIIYKAFGQVQRICAGLGKLDLFLSTMMR